MDQATTTLHQITLHLARHQSFPSGSTLHGYSFIAPLDASGHIDPAAWRLQRANCTVERFWGREPVRQGVLVHRSGGTSGATWGFDYDSATLADDEMGYRFGSHVFAPGEYVSIREADGEMLTFKVVYVAPV